jgi:hypothetical protein
MKTRNEEPDKFFDWTPEQQFAINIILIDDLLARLKAPVGAVVIINKSPSHHLITDLLMEYRKNIIEDESKK